MSQRKKRALILNLGIFISLVLIAGLLFYFSQEYKFNKFVDRGKRFSIKYPHDWVVKESFGQGVVVVFASLAENELDTISENFSVTVQKIDAGGEEIGLEEYSEEFIKSIKTQYGSSVIPIESTPMQVSGLPGFKFIFVGKSDKANFKFQSIWTIKDNMAYQLTFTATTLTFDNYLGTANRMVKSFKLLGN